MVLKRLGPDGESRALLQITPKMAEDIAGYDIVIFIDSDTIVQDLTIEPLDELPAPPALTYAATPAEIIELSRALFGFKGRAFLCRIPVDDLRFGEGRSQRTSELALQAIGELESLLGDLRTESLQPQIMKRPIATLVLGLGNLLRSDDGVGVHAIRRLQRDSIVPPRVVLMDGGTQGLSLLPHISGFRRILMIVAVDAGQPPGTIIRLEGDAVEKFPGKTLVRRLGFADLMIALKFLGECPKEVIVIGMQPQSSDWSVELTAPVGRSLGELLAVVIAQLESWARLPEVK
jgi:hydrogenase maturation protease